jgi:hypothetical protein
MNMKPLVQLLNSRKDVAVAGTDRVIVERRANQASAAPLGYPCMTRRSEPQQYIQQGHSGV